VLTAIVLLQVQAARAPAPPVLDGRLADSVWALAVPVGGLRQVEPDEGAPVSESTTVRVLYDDDALYVGARLFDAQPNGIITRLGRRDAVTHSDEFRLFLDTRHDRRSAYEFVVNPAGVRQDALLGGDGDYSDDSWDPVWEAATSVDSAGWTAEIRIPLSQLRFAPDSSQVWGIRLVRWIQRKNELAMYPFVPKTESGVASRFGELVGLTAVPHPTHLEVLPYLVARDAHAPPAPARDPFAAAHRAFGDAGIDAKYGVSTNVTLDLTVNPDFGQVEVDPAYVNLTDFEQFLQERRPFFIEGGDIFTFGGNGGGLVKFSDPPLFFYSRRIGRPPQGRVTAPGQFVDMPEQTTILGAGKLSGRRASGWSLGLLEAVTARERAGIADTLAGTMRSNEVEPLTNYLVGRMKRDLRRGNTTIGILGTAVDRDLDIPALHTLRSAAYTGGVDFFHRWGGNHYTLAGSIGRSLLLGDTAAIAATQRSSSRYFQRPDARRFHFDPLRTALAGGSGDLALNRVGGHWTWSIAGAFVSPGFEVNDLGFQQRVDRRLLGAAAQHRWTRPVAVFRQAVLSLSHARGWNYDGDPIQNTLTVYGFGQLHNFWSADLTLTRAAPVWDDRLTRGGPVARKPGAVQAAGELYSDYRQRVGAYLYSSYYRNAAGGWLITLLPQVTLQSGSAVSVVVGPEYLAGREAAHFLRRVTDSTATGTAGVRYVFAGLREASLDLSIRVNATVSPALSAQLYAQPFVFAGQYATFAELRAARTFRFDRYGVDNGSTITRGGGTVTVDPDGPGPAAPFSFADPDFRSRSLRVNAVMRWEYRRGSTLFVAWTQRRSGFVSGDGRLEMGRDLGEPFRDPSTNVFLVKLSYWLTVR
jgi:hypothetical protein